MYSPSAPPTELIPTSQAPTSQAPTSQAPTSQAPTSQAPTSHEETPLLINMNENVVVNEDKNLCIICLEEKDGSNKYIISINELPFLNKSCTCHFYIHEKCFNLWFFKNPKCPICSSGLSYNEIIIPIHYRNINNSNINNECILSFDDDRVSYIKFLKNVTLLLIFLTFLSFISFYVYPFNQ